jgi:hypothetical protein
VPARSGNGSIAMPVDDETPFDPRPIVEVLVRHGVAFVAIGGWAASLQGSPFPTDDVDITPKLERTNLDRLSAALTELQARIWAAGEPEGLPFAHDADSLAESRVWNLTSPFGRFDISFVPNGTEGFADLDRDARDFMVSDGVVVRLASLADIIRSKQATNRPKDQRVLPLLREILAEESAERRASRRAKKPETET